MKAVELIKEFGIEYAIKILNYDPSILDDVCHLDFGETKNLKQIVDAFELVEGYGGLEVAKTCEYSEDLDHVKYNVDLAKAINLVEQCQ